MKVLMVNRALPCHVAGGLERHVEDLAFGLAGAGFEIHLLTAPVGDPPTLARLAAHGIVHHGAECARPRRYSLAYLRGIGRCIADHHARHGFDVIHGQEFSLGFWRPRRGSPPVVLSVHGTITSETPLHADCRNSLSLDERIWAWGRFGRRYLFHPAWTRTVRRAARILVDSAFTRDELDRLVPDCRGNIRRVPLAIREDRAGAEDREAARLALGWTGAAPRLVTVGRLEWQKGQDLALKALAGLRGVDWHYTIAGEGSARPSLERSIARLRLEQRVDLAGRVDEARKRQMLAAADLVVWPERTHPAFGLTGLEALMQGTPVVGTPRGAVAEVLGSRGGWLAADATAEALQACLKPLLEAPERLARRREGLRADALKRFDFQRMVETVARHYMTVVKEHSRD